MKKICLQIQLFLLLAIICCTSCSMQNNNSPNVKSESLYDRVMKTGKIRCGYAMFPPYCTKDPNTGKLSGIFVDVLEEAGKNLNLKIIWSEEVGWGTIIEGLEANRYDIVPGVWPNSHRGKHASFSVPLFYNAYKAYARTNDNRFNQDLHAINSPSVTISTIDGYRVADMAEKRFPNAHKLTHPEMVDGSQVLLDVVNHKADVTFADPSLVALFLKNNPTTIKNVSSKPIEIEPTTIMFKIGEPAFESMLNTALTELIYNGNVDSILNKYEPSPGVYLRVATPYQTEKSK